MRSLCRTLTLAVPLAVLLTASSAHASSTTIPLNSVQKVVLDSAHGQVFVSGQRDDPSQTSLFVMNTDGTLKQSIPGETLTAGLALDGTTLYVGRCRAGDGPTQGIIDAIDTVTLTRIESIPVALTPHSTDLGICNVAVAGGRIWYTPGDQSQDLAAVDIAAPHTQHTYAVGTSIYDEQFATSATDPNLLIVADSNSSGTSVHKYDVSGATPVLATPLYIGEQVRGMAISPDGATFVAAADAEVWRYDVATLTQQGSYSTNGARADGLALSPDGGYVAVVVGDGVRFYHADTGALIGTRSLSPQSSAFGQIAFSADGMALYAPTWASFRTAPITFRLLSNPILPTPALTLKASATTVGYGGHVKLTVHLGGSHTNHSVHIYRTVYGGSRMLLKTVTVGSSGNYTFTSPALARRTTFQAEYDGDATSGFASSTNVTIKVRALITIAASGFYAVSGGYHLYHYRAGCWTGTAPCPVLLGRIRPARAGATMTFVMQHHTASGWATSVKGTASTNSQGYAKAIFHYTGSAFIGLGLRAHVTWGGDAGNLGGRSGWTYLRITS
jgi:DNA-binding beta-propeller fold protein YncE